LFRDASGESGSEGSIS